MTAEEASRWAKQRTQGRLRYALRSGLWFTARFFAALLLVQLWSRHSSPVPLAAWMGLAATVAAACSLLEFFRWNYLEFRFFVFNKAQACSGSESRA